MMKPHVNKDLMIVYQEIAVSITKKRPFFLGTSKENFLLKKPGLILKYIAKIIKQPQRLGENGPFFKDKRS